MMTYKYWAEPMSKEDDRILKQQLARAAAYRRELVRIENLARVLTRAIMALPDKEERKLYHQLVSNAHRAACKAARERCRADPRAEEYRRELVRLESLAGVLNRAIEALPDKEERKLYHKRVSVAHRKASEAAKAQAGTAAGDELGLSWGSCAMVDEAHDFSQRTTMIYNDVKQTARWDEGLLAVQYQRHETDKAQARYDERVTRYRSGGLEALTKRERTLLLDNRGEVRPFRPPVWRPTIASQFVGGSDSFVRIGANLIGKPTLRAQRHGETMGARNLRELMFRVGTVPGGREPLWARLYVLMDRPLPEARTTWVKLSCRRVGLRYRWHLIVIVDEDFRRPVLHARAEAVGIDIGWRKLDNGDIRIAYWYGSDGQEGELSIPERVYQRKEKADSLHAICDRTRNEMSLEWRTWMQQFVLDDHPLRIAAKDMHLWVKMWRFAKLARLWQDNRVAGDGEMFERVHAWLKQDRHLLSWEVNNRRRLSLQVAGRISDMAHQLVQRYEMVAVEERGMVPKLVARPKNIDPGSSPSAREDEWLRAVNARRVGILAPALMRQTIEYRCRKYGSLYREEEAAFTTISCPSCGVERVIDDPASLLLTCNVCNVTDDQDRTAARNLLTRARRRLAAEVAEAAAVPESTAAKPKKLGARRTRKGAASKALAAVES